MGLIAGITNPTTIAEKPIGLIFPSSPQIRNEIPIYLKLTCVEYSQNAISRAGFQTNTAGNNNIKAQIVVPYPSKNTTQTALRYKQEENIARIPVGNINLNEKIEQFLEEQAQKGSGIGVLIGALKGLGLLNASMISTQIDSDFTETILQSGSKRSFQIQLYLPCLSTEDSVAASKIITAFEALSLPTYAGVNAGVGKLGIELFFHPPMWFIGAGRLDSIENVIPWTSQPQASVITNVAVNRTAIDAPSLVALSDGNPFAYSVTLNFQEIETAVRVGSGTDDTSLTIKNRSGASYSAVARVIAPPSGG